MSWLIYLWPFMLLLVLSGLAKLYEMTRTTFSHPTLGQFTRQGEVWAGLVQGREAAIRIELRGSSKEPLDQDLTGMAELWNNRESILEGEEEPVEIKAHKQHFELIYERGEDQATRLIPRTT